MTELKIKGMHCEACKTLVTMELEEAGFGSNIEAVELIADQEGKLSLADVSEEDVEEIKKLINSMEKYQVND